MAQLTNDDLAVKVATAVRTYARATATLSDDRERQKFLCTWRGELVAEFEVGRLGQADTQKLLDALVSSAAESSRLAGLLDA